MNLNIFLHSPKGSKNNQGKIACVKRVIVIHYKLKPLVLFSAGNAKDDTTKIIKHAKVKEYQWLTDIMKQLKTTVFVSFLSSRKGYKNESK